MMSVRVLTLFILTSSDVFTCFYTERASLNKSFNESISIKLKVESCFEYKCTLGKVWFEQD